MSNIDVYPFLLASIFVVEASFMFLTKEIFSKNGCPSIDFVTVFVKIKDILFVAIFS